MDSSSSGSGGSSGGGSGVSDADSVSPPNIAQVGQVSIMIGQMGLDTLALFYFEGGAGLIPPSPSSHPLSLVLTCLSARSSYANFGQ